MLTRVHVRREIRAIFRDSPAPAKRLASAPRPTLLSIGAGIPRLHSSVNWGGNMIQKVHYFRAAVAGLLVLLPLTGLAARVPTTLLDFFLPGTQPSTLTEPMLDAYNCSICHGYFDNDNEPFLPWAASMMGQASRDPVFLACLDVANQDAAFVGDMCLRCHSPNGWLAGRSEPTDGSAMSGIDLQGVSCHVCHRMVDPVHDPGVDPAVDADILAALSNPPASGHNGSYVIDPQDRRRGPYNLTVNPHQWLKSPYHRASDMCATCHDVSNPAFTRQPDGSYALNDLNTPHPTHDRYQQFPLERTFSEWSMSEFALGPVEMGGRFGGNLSAVSSCQDCHMPKATGQGCYFGEEHTDLGRHYFNGGNTWVLQAIHNLYDSSETMLEDATVAASIARAVAMLQAASDLELSATESTLTARVINQGGHKLPTGYPEGRRMWLNVRFFSLTGGLIAERGAYDTDTATLSTDDTIVYEAKLGLDAAVAAATGLPEGESFHFAINNTWIKDNRIPPRGFTNANFEQIQAAPVGHAYADGQYWDDAAFAIPPGAVRADVRVYYQTTSREYIEFLRDNTVSNAGQIAYDQWVLTGKSAPVEMDFGTLALACGGDLDGDGSVGIGDLALLLSHFGTPGGAEPGDGDFDVDGDVDLSDLTVLLSVFGSLCP